MVALPTDTIYGITCSTVCTEAIQRIYSIKGRIAAKPLAICVAEASDVDRYTSPTTAFTPTKVCCVGGGGGGIASTNYRRT